MLRDVGVAGSWVSISNVTASTIHTFNYPSDNIYNLGLSTNMLTAGPGEAYKMISDGTFWYKGV